MDVQTAAQNVAEDYKGGARQLAHDIDKNATTFAHQLSETGPAVLGLRTAVKMTKRSKDLRILNAFAEECGCMVLPLPEALMSDDSAVMQGLGVLAKEFSDVVQEICASSADDDINDNEMARAEKEWGQVVAAGQRVLGAMRAKNQASKVRIVGLPVRSM
jgi:hypothetical protein